MGCRLAKAGEWAMRIQHEAKLHDANSFVTLTYNDLFLPDTYSVSVKALQLFMKRLRKALGNERVRFFGCGEYGEENLRPHYHVMIFGYDFPDKKPWRKTGSGHLTYISEELAKIWPFGHHEIGNVQIESAGYVARYCMKKITGKEAAAHYNRIHPLTGEQVQVSPEFITMSRRPGLGEGWFTRYATDAFPSDFVIVDGQKKQPPRYYMKLLKRQEGDDKLAPRIQTKVSTGRKANARARAHDNTPERLAVREEVTRLRVQRLRREMDR